MESTKKSTKKTLKAVKPSFIIDITNVYDEQSLSYEIAKTKREAGIQLTDENIDALINEAVNNCVCETICPVVIQYCECHENHINKPWYKRFWNWLIGRK